MKEWLKMLTCSLCILTILMHLVPQRKFAKYVRFYAGLLFCFLAMKPVLGLFGKDGELERLLSLEFLKEEYYDMETAVDGMEELKNDVIRTSYQQEIVRQIREIAAAYGFWTADVQACFDAGEGYTLSSVRVSAEIAEGQEQAADELRNEISGVYLLEPGKIMVGE